MKKTFVLFLTLCTVVISATAQHKEYDSLTYVSKQGDTLPFRQLNPLQVEEGKKYPLVLFLHGAGERGVNVEYPEFPGVNHNSWDPAFNRDDILPWLFRQKNKNK